MLDTHIGPIHYGAGEDTEIDTAWELGVLDDAPWLHKMVKAGFNVYMGSGTTDFDSGQIVRYVHPASGEDVTFEAQQLQWTNDLDQIEAIADPQTISHTSIDDDTIYWDGAYGAGLDFRWQAQTARLAKYLTIQSLVAIGSPPQFIIDGGNPVLRMGFIFQKSSGIDIYIDGVLWNEKSNNPQTTEGNVEFRLNGESLWWFKQASATDSGDGDAPVIRQRFRAVAANLFVEVLVPWTWLQSAVYPVEIDPTIDDQVGASADDGKAIIDISNWGLTSTNAYLGRNDGTTHYAGWYIFKNISGLSGSTINTSYISLYTDVVSGDGADTIITAEDVETATQFATYSAWDGRTDTPESVVWTDIPDADGWTNSPSINTIIQELADSYDPDQIGFTIIDDYGDTSQRRTRYKSYDDSTTLCAKLHIEYTAGGGVSIPVIMHHYRQQGMT